MGVKLQKPWFDEKKKQWRAGYSCTHPLCRIPTKKGFKSERHWVYTDLKRQLQDKADREFQNHDADSFLMKRLNKAYGRDPNKITFAQMNDEVLNEYAKGDNDNSSTIQYHETALAKTTKGGNWEPPFFNDMYIDVTEDDVFNWYLKLEDYMLKNKNYHGVAYKSGKFKQIDDAIKRISEHAVLVHKLKPIHAERTRILSTKIRRSLKSNHRTIHGVKEFNPKLVANMIALVDRISNEEDSRYKLLSTFLKTSICLCTRAGETCGLRIGDVHFGLNGDVPIVTVERQIKFISNSPKLIETGRPTGIVEHRTKGRRKRDVPVTDKNIAQWLQMVAIEFDTGQRKADNFGNQGLWQNAKGNPFTPEDIRRKLDRFCKRYEKRFLDEYGHDTKGYSLHSLRHAGASYLTAKTNDINLVKNILGHTNISMTADRYSHVTHEHLMNAPDMTSILGGGDQ